jgi:D-glycero-alpha-D-manno-heptose-7-phosphate kinase
MIFARAPFRISLGGGGTDLPSYYSQYGGFILSAAINKYLYLYVNRPAADRYIRVKYSCYEQVSCADEVKHDLVRPALKLLDLDGSLEIVSMADVPAGTGLGSSGTYLVALLAALYELKRKKVSMQQLAEAACHIEMDLAAHPVGKQDHYLAAFGGVTCLDIASDGQVTVSPLPVTTTIVEDLRNSVMLFYTGITRSSARILQAQKEQTLRGDPTVVESLHHTKELGCRIKEALVRDDIEEFGRLLDEHWQNKKRRSALISDPHIDKCYELAMANGALGGKVIGAGGGGFLMICCPNQCRGRIRNALQSEGLREMPYDFDFEGAKVMFNI